MGIEMDQETYAAIQATARNFDIASVATEKGTADDEDVLNIIHRASGRSGDVPTDALIGSDSNGDTAIPLEQALDAESVRKSDTWRIADQTMQDAIVQHETKARDIKTKNPTRHQDRAEGIREALTILGNIFADAEERLKNTSTEERTRMPARTTQVSAATVKARANALEPDLPEPKTAQEIKDQNDKRLALLLRQKDQTQDAVTWLEQHPKNQLVS